MNELPTHSLEHTVDMRLVQGKTACYNIYCANERMQREIVLSFLLHAWTEGSSLISHQLHQEYEQTVNNNPDSGTTFPHVNFIFQTFS